MFDRLVKRPRALARHLEGPMAEERRRYLTHCADQQMSRDSLQRIASNTLIVAQILRLADRPSEFIARSEIEAEARNWVTRRPRPRPVRNVRIACRTLRGHAIRWLTFLGRLQPRVAAPQPYADHVAQFADYLLRERGLSPRTVAYSWQAIQGFLTQLDDAHLRLRTLTAIQLDDVVAQKVRDGRYSRASLKRWATTLRPFFRFAEEQGWCCPGLAGVLQTPRVYSHDSLPLGPSWDDVQRLLTACDEDRPVDIRDRALLMLLAVYGLRAGEAAALRLDDFDWDRELLTVRHGKQKRARVYPLCRPVGDAVLRYLREARPQSERREVFLTVLAPVRPLLDRSLSGMVGRHLHALGLTLPRYGAHALRETLA